MSSDEAQEHSESDRLYVPTFAELIDRLSVDQIKETLLAADQAVYTEEIRRIEHDLDAVINEKGLKLSARTLRIVIVIAQMNLHIWHSKDRMQREPEQYDDLLKLAHQLNGVRNRMKNLLLDQESGGETSTRHTNVETDDLEGWSVSI